MERPIYQYRTDQDFWYKYCEIQVDLYHFFETFFMDDSLFFIGRQRHGETVNEVSSLNFKTKTFNQLPPLNLARVSHSIAMLYDKIYVIGGRNGFLGDAEIFKSVEMYSISYGWKQIKGMITPRYGAAAVAYNGKMYVMGGLNGVELKSVEFYDPLTDSWTPCADMIGENACFSATVNKGRIFVACGSDKDFSATVECYDPLKNEWTKIWTFEDTIYAVKTCCINYLNRVFVYFAICGESYPEEYENCMWAFIEEDNEWLDIEKLPMIPSLHYCFTVPKNCI